MGALAAAEAVTSSSCRAMSPFPDRAIPPFPTSYRNSYQGPWVSRKKESFRVTRRRK